MSKNRQDNGEVKEQESSAIPKKRQDVLKLNGWGYKDSGFIFQNGLLEFIGNRYPIGNLKLPYFTKWVVETLGGNFTKKSMIQEPNDYNIPNINESFINELKLNNISYSLNNEDRLFHSHGHTLSEIYNIRMGKPSKLPDIIIYPTCHGNVLIIIKLAVQFNIVIIPFGGGTSVTEGLCCPEDETRTIASVDTSQMNKILWIDEKNLTCCAESGILGQDIEKQLKLKGYTTGHEPDSYEFSSLGGWVSTRASGMKKNTYGNIEDLIIHIKMVTPNGVIEKYNQVPRSSSGPDIHHFILGSEGCFGIITEVVVKIRPIPKCIKYGSIIFDNFKNGVDCLREIARQRCQPSSIRLMDNEQFKFGHSLRPHNGYSTTVKDNIKSLYLTKFKGFDLDAISIATLLFEGDEDDVKMKEFKIYNIAKEYNGFAGGNNNGERGYILTFVIAYIRDIALDYHIVAESFETSVPWSHTYQLCENVKLKVKNECKANGLKHYFITCRVTQTYDSGACVYFYFAFNYSGISQNPIKLFEHIEHIARDEILLNQGSISHHHGVGKIRKQWMNNTISNTSINSLTFLKKSLDPTNIFANNNLIDFRSKL